MQQKLKKLSGEQGFTIIEVLIVLAIAGMMMLVVFLAVPALQRNSRNSQRQSDASRMVAAVNECITNNNGRVAQCQDFTAAELSNYYDLLDNQQLETPGGVGLNEFTLAYDTQCDDTGTSSQSGGGSRSFTITYEIETDNGTAGRCIGS